MYFVDINMITGVAVGVEYISDKDLQEEGNGWTLIIDLFILRFLLQKVDVK